MISLYGRSDSFLLTAQRRTLELDVVFDVVLCVPAILMKWKGSDESFVKVYHPISAAGSPC